MYVVLCILGCLALLLCTHMYSLTPNHLNWMKLHDPELAVSSPPPLIYFLSWAAAATVALARPEYDYNS